MATVEHTPIYRLAHACMVNAYNNEPRYERSILPFLFVASCAQFLAELLPVGVFTHD
jgi:hypothetical protein